MKHFILSKNRIRSRVNVCLCSRKLTECEATEFFATNSRSMLASMNQMRYGIEYHLSMPETIKEINLDRIENWQLEYLFSTGKKLMDYTTAGTILSELMLKLS